VSEVKEVPVGGATFVGRILAHWRDDDPVPQFQTANANWGEQSCLRH
jgi:hypothetical protein